MSSFSLRLIISPQKFTFNIWFYCAGVADPRNSIADFFYVISYKSLRNFYFIIYYFIFLHYCIMFTLYSLTVYFVRLPWCTRYLYTKPYIQTLLHMIRFIFKVSTLESFHYFVTYSTRFVWCILWLSTKERLKLPSLAFSLLLLLFLFGYRSLNGFNVF